ncbi:hypothetical protein CF161_25938 [Pseudomonas sp. CF161]|nr:hypothetical protein CF161_25938 [Pseudomonas sp. CF161]
MDGATLTQVFAQEPQERPRHIQLKGIQQFPRFSIIQVVESTKLVNIIILLIRMVWKLQLLIRLRGLNLELSLVIRDAMTLKVTG